MDNREYIEKVEVSIRYLTLRVFSEMTRYFISDKKLRPDIEIASYFSEKKGQGKITYTHLNFFYIFPVFHSTEGFLMRMYESDLIKKIFANFDSATQNTPC